MKIEKTQTYGWEAAFRGLRNPMDSWTKSDSLFGLLSSSCEDNDFDAVVYNWIQNIEKQQGNVLLPDDYEDKEIEVYSFLYKNGIIRQDNNFFEYAYLGPNDLDLAQRMIAGGRPNDKFLRQIFVSVDITAPLYWWKEMDTYKVGTVANSTSTMHTLSKKPITLDCFETDDMVEIGRANSKTWEIIISICEDLRQKYNETKDIRYWKELIRILPESWLQLRTWTANYDVLRNIYHWRKNHKLTEWRTFCNWIESLPYSSELILYKND